jgi:hypothetical protein
MLFYPDLNFFPVKTLTNDFIPNVVVGCCIVIAVSQEVNFKSRK